jgi:hypothetical protein
MFEVMTGEIMTIWDVATGITKLDGMLVGRLFFETITIDECDGTEITDEIYKVYPVGMKTGD